MSIDFTDLGGSVASFLSGDGTLSSDTPVEQPAPEQGQAGSPVPRQDETPPAPQPDAAVEASKTDTELKPEDTTGEKPEGSESSDTPSEGEEFKGPKELREAYKTLKETVAPYKEFLDEVQTQGVSPVLLKEAKSVFDSYLALDAASELGSTQEATNAFLSNLYQLSPSAFQVAMMGLVDDNKELIAKRIFGAEVTAEDIAAFRQFKETGATPTSSNVDDEIVVPEFDPVTGEPLSDEVKELIRNQGERIKAFNEQERQRKEQERVAQAAKAQEDAERENAQIQAAIDTYRNERLKVVDNTIAKNLGLQDSPKDTDEVKAEKAMLREIIQGATISAFGSDAKARKFYKEAVEHIAEGKTKLAEGKAFNIERAMGEHASRVAEFLMSLYSKAYTTESAQVQKAATGDRPEISDTGAVVNTAQLDASKLTPFSKESIEARLAHLEASGVLPPRK
jgi:hypothetical protein